MSRVGELEIAPQELVQRLTLGAQTQLVDVRQKWEHALVALPDSQLIPLNELAERWREIVPAPGGLVVAYCHHGVRSLHAAALLNRAGLNVRSLKGGIDRWSLEIDPALARY